MKRTDHKKETYTLGKQMPLFASADGEPRKGKDNWLLWVNFKHGPPVIEWKPNLSACYKTIDRHNGCKEWAIYRAPRGGLYRRSS